MVGSALTGALGTVLLTVPVVASGVVRLLYPNAAAIAATDPGTRRPPGGTP